MQKNTHNSASSCFAFGLGLASRNTKGDYLESYFPAPLHALPESLASALGQVLKQEHQQLSDHDLNTLKNLFETAGETTQANTCHSLSKPPPGSPQVPESSQVRVAVLLTEDTEIQSVPGAYLKLHLLSHRLVLPNSMVLDGLFAHLPTVVWTDRGAVDPAEIDQQILEARLRGEHLVVHGLDKFPRMLDYVIPSGVRIADASRVRLGAYLGEGTTVMHEGFMNFNSATLGPNMVEGRISQGVVVGAHSDLGGGSSTMGTLSGGGNMTITLGENCLIGANGGTGIPLGDRCTIESGLYITAGTPVRLIYQTETGETQEKQLKARQLAGQSDLLFLRNGQTGQVECRANRHAIELNETLHAHN